MAGFKMSYLGSSVQSQRELRDVLDCASLCVRLGTFTPRNMLFWGGTGICLYVHVQARRSRRSSVTVVTASRDERVGNRGLITGCSKEFFSYRD